VVYGITEQDYLDMLETQDGVCQICGHKSRGRDMLCVDHSHSTGKVRGLLCSMCNTALGLMKENKTWLTRMIQYIEEHE